MKHLLALALLLLAALPARANDWDLLSVPGVIPIMRHALAPGTGDPAGFKVTDCATQRNLDDRGRAQARAVGAKLRARGHAFDRVLTSQWCRCRETAALLDIGPVQEAPPLNSLFANRSDGPAQTHATRALLEVARDRVFLVTHQVNITALTGQPVASGEIILFRFTDGGVEVLGDIHIRP